MAITQMVTTTRLRAPKTRCYGSRSVSKEIIAYSSRWSAPMINTAAPPITRRVRGAQGFTLVEIMISLAIGA
ncbi:MAG: prepilin-type N-terminal cleavage/methylation domain-containing protein, partial [Gammaproteobacteria bacterium]